MADSNDSLAPIFIFSPSARCGITLLQRLLNSTRRIMIYGENAFLVNALPQHLLTIAGTAEKHQAARQRVVKGDSDFWSSSVWPDVRSYSQVLVKSLEMVLRNYKQDAMRDGFQHWGVKNPLYDGKHFELFYHTLPQGRFIFIHRHILDVARSYKARKWLNSEQDCTEMVRQWGRNMFYMLSCRSNERILMIRYDQMLANPEEHAQRLEAFVGVEGIDRSIFGRKINTFTGAGEAGYSATQYVEPEELSAQQVEIISRMANDLLKRWDYHPVGPIATSPMVVRPQPVRTAPAAGSIRA